MISLAFSNSSRKRSSFAGSPFPASPPGTRKPGAGGRLTGSVRAGEDIIPPVFVSLLHSPPELWGEEGVAKREASVLTHRGPSRPCGGGRGLLPAFRYSTRGFWALHQPVSGPRSRLPGGHAPAGWGPAARAASPSGRPPPAIPRRAAGASGASAGPSSPPPGSRRP